MGKKIVIRKEQEAYMQQLRAWLEETKEDGLEEMADFFRMRLEGYEEHMSVWKEAYVRLAQLISPQTKELLDLGCGTGLELDEILAVRPQIFVTGVDLSPDMLGRLREKHPQVRTICGDYFQIDLPEEAFDTAISVESLHHFTPEKKAGLYRKIARALRPGGALLVVDYLACCEEEERLLTEICKEKRAAARIPEEMFVHFDTPLTAEHELELIRGAGFERAELTECINGASFIRAYRPEGAV